MYHHNNQINPIFKNGSKDAAALLIHGFTATPDCLRPLANHLHSLGFTVAAPLLAGHGTTREHLAKTTWKDWYNSCQKVYLELLDQYNHVTIAGLSLGGVLALKLAQDYPQGVTALACLATPIFLNRWITTLLPVVVNSPLHYFYKYQKKADADVKDPNARKNYWSIQDMPLESIYSLTKLQHIVRQDLAKIITPSLLMHSRYDSTAPYESLNYISKHLSSKVTETVTLENSFHLITIDYEKDIVNEKVGDFFTRFL